jgi:hypothetical protein
MDDAAIRATALSIAQNRTPTDTVEAEATKLYDWMIAREQPGVQCAIAANNKVSPQDNVDGVITSATADYAFLTGGDGTPVIPWPPVAEVPLNPQMIPPVLMRDELVKTIMGAQIAGQTIVDNAEDAGAIADAVMRRQVSP